MALTGDQQYLWKSFNPSHFSFNFQYCDTEYRAVFKLPREPFLKTKSELDVRLDDRSVWCRSRKKNRRFFFPKSKENSIKSKESWRKKQQEVFTPSSKESSQGTGVKKDLQRKSLFMVFTNPASFSPLFKIYDAYLHNNELA